MRLQLIALMFLSLFAGSLNAQESTSYFFLGNVFTTATDGTEHRFPYLPIQMALATDLDNPVAVGMTNGNGEISFYGVPMDIHRDYVFTVVLPSGTYRFLRKGLANPSFKSGNVNAHIKLDAQEPYYKVQTLQATNEQGKLSFIDFVAQSVGATKREDLSLTNKEGLPYRIMLGGQELPPQKLALLNSKITASMLEKVLVITPTLPNDYFAGVIDLYIPGISKKAIEKTSHYLPRL